MFRFRAALVVACFIASVTPALAASTGIVRGIVTASGTPQAGAEVNLVGEGSTLDTTTNSRGQFAFAAVPFGHYLLTVHKTGTAVRSVDVTVNSDAVSTANIDLLKTIAITAVTATSGISGTPVAVTTIDKSQIGASPVNTSLDRLLETIPGVVQFSYNEPVINGFHGVTYQIDGAPLPIATTSNFAEIVDPKDIDSLEVFTGAIPAEYGGDRMGGVVNIITDRFEDLAPGISGTISGGVGSQAQSLGSLDLASRFGNNEIFLNLNSSATARGVDAPTYDPIHDASSANDQFLRWVSRLNNQATVSFDYSTQFSQYQIPINTDPNNLNDPIYSPAGTDDTQLEYNRFANLNFTQTSKDGNSVFQLIPWFRSTRVDYNGDLANDVLSFGPNVGCAPDGDPTLYPNCSAGGGASGTSPVPDQINGVGLQSANYANYLGLRGSELHSSNTHTWKIGFDMNRENSTASQTYACYYVGCALQASTTSFPTVANAANGYPAGYYASGSSQAQPGSQFALYAQDKWQAAQNVTFDYGVRYDHSTGYTSGYMIEPRVGVNISDGGKNIFHAFYGRYYAAPFLEDVRNACVIFQAQGGCATTTPVYDLQPEMDSYYEMGIQHRFNGNLTGWANLFDKNVVNILDTTQLLNTPLFAVYNNAIGRDVGIEIRLQDRTSVGSNWFYTMTMSNSLAGGISGGTFLFPPNVNNGLALTDPAQLSPEDHSQSFDSTAGYTSYFGKDRKWFTSLQADYGSGFPVAFEDANINLSGTLPAHTTFDFSAGRNAATGRNSQGLGFSLQVLNLLNHQYVIKVANGFNTTQIANGRTVLFRFTQPF